MTLVQSVLSAQNHIVAHKVDILRISLSRFDVEVLKSNIVTRGRFGAVEQNDTVSVGCAGNV